MDEPLDQSADQPEDPAAQEGALLRMHLFAGDLLQLPAPEEGLPGFLPPWYSGELPALVYPPLAERGLEDQESVDLQITPYHIYYGALRELAETADAERAATLRRLVLEWNPTSPVELCELARYHVERDVETALLHYELALEIEPELYEAVQDAGMCEYALASQQEDEEERGERLETALEYFRRAVELRPTAGLSWWSLARLQYERGDAAGAQRTLERFLVEQPEGEQRDMIEGALQEGFEGLDAAGGGVSDEQAVFVEAQQAAFGGQPERAVELLEPLVAVYPDTWELWFVLGGAHRRAGDLAEAERCLRRMTRLAPSEPLGWLELGRTYLDMREWRQVEEASRKGLELDPENAAFHCLLGRGLLGQGDREGAAEAIETARELVPDDPEVREALAELEKE